MKARWLDGGTSSVPVKYHTSRRRGRDRTFATFGRAGGAQLLRDVVAPGGDLSHRRIHPREKSL